MSGLMIAVKATVHTLNNVISQFEYCLLIVSRMTLQLVCVVLSYGKYIYSVLSSTVGFKSGCGVVCGVVCI